ncbi:MAG: sugar transferase [Pelatocladus maniniholoensis HA4357-MV3]|jgi:exopolysaccharide biosynthesis polyprenyl glycosylphosphotransferase|uniref:Sugar transferase n=1 Tax=Pelatocladus maniniholoensis HA4357-MV3 TaxID=1117104 RepID=A0A9E3HBE4_9NOST|nr:sugar transferase [Pelatocladus maniniholoensis HA4357-MV3]BAZ69120.1 sugar transferase [Fischerella sp. NIES-4106]
MTTKYLPIVSFKPDLRCAKGTRIQRGLALRFFRVLTLVSLDALALILAWSLAILYGTPLDSPWTQKAPFIILTLALEIGIISTKGLYKAGIQRRNYPGIIKAVSLSQVLLLFIAFLYEPNHYVSRSTFLIFWLSSLLFICIGRYLFDVGTKLLRRKGAIRHPIFLITEIEDKENHTRIIEKENCYIIQGIADSRCLDLCNRESTFEYLRQQGIVEAFVSWSAIKNRLYVCWNFHTAGITLRILPTDSEIRPAKSTFLMIGEVPCMTIPAPIIAGSDFWIKRCFDLCCSVILLVLLFPVYLSIAILIKLDSPGPVFFRQERIGLHSRKFKIWKFRTMVTNAEKLQANLEAKNEIKDGVLFKMKDDPRITQVGKFLRRYSLDELPQLFNVFLGEMSLVGPRPLPIRDVEKFQTKHFIRQEVLPGITGLWQVSGRSDIEKFEDAVKLDLTYIENWSLWLDLKILLQTVKVVMQKTGAY